MSHRQRHLQRRRRRRLTLRQQRTRRGVLLLVTLSLLVLFLMVGSAFLLTAKQADKAAKASARGAAASAAAADQGLLLDEVALQVLRGSKNRRSSLHAHSLLEDMYGLDGFASVIPPPNTPIDGAFPGCLGALPPLPNSGGGRATAPYADPATTAAFTVRWPDSGALANAVPDVTGGQLLEIDLAAFQTNLGVPESAAARSVADDAYAGQVLTFVSGPARGRSTRIVSSLHRGNWITLRVMEFPLEDGSRLPKFAEAGQNGVQNLLQGSRVVVNGRPFSGTGAGFDPSVVGNPPQARLAMRELVGGVPRPVALLPNAAFFEPNLVQFANAGSTTGGAWQQYFGPHALLLDEQPLSNLNFTPEYLRPLAGLGGADESYDAADFQNMALALLPGSNNLDERVDFGSDDLDDMPLPSFHRPALLNYWRTQLQQNGGALELDPLLLRKVLLRPSWLDHPNFTGSNPDLLAAVEGLRLALQSGGDASTFAAELMNHAIYGPWDVDNDGDGIRDSVWVDFGAPVMIGPNGKLVKPLAAVLCLDMDGRINVNAAGSLDLADAVPKVGVTDPSYQRLADQTTMSDRMPRGLGYGPADISLQPALGGDFRRLLTGDRVQGVTYPGRYGQSHLDQRPGRVGVDLRARLDRFGWPDAATEFSCFAEPPDLNCRYGVGVNTLGQPVIEGSLTSELSTRNNPASFTLTAESPYEIDLSDLGARGEESVSADMPFGVAELERVLRCFDADAGTLPERLFLLAGINSDASDRSRITTDSFDLPAPNVRIPTPLRGIITPGAALPRTTSELLEARVRWVLNQRDAANYPLFPQTLPGPIDPTNDVGNNVQITPAEQVRNIVRVLLAPELAAGERLDVNRPFGNGRDDPNPGTGQGNGVVDEPSYRGTARMPAQGEGLVSASLVWQNATAGGSIGMAVAAPVSQSVFEAARYSPLDANGNGSSDIVDDELQRQLLARHLFVMALTLSADADYGRSQTLTDEQKALAQRLAQWSVNAVDFRDPDNIMTPFEYDANPFDGWDVDGDLRTLNDSFGQDGRPGTDDDLGGLVWGCERPELVMTETLAWHDRRTNNSGQEEKYPPDSDEDASLTTAQRNPDLDYDQIVRPRGAFFVELYNPWGTTPGANADTHARQGFYDAGVDLGAVSEVRRGPQSSPVWRMVVHKRRDLVRNRESSSEEAMAWDPDALDPRVRPQTPVDRSVYFSGFDPDHPDDGVAFFNDVGGRGREAGDPAPSRPNLAPPVRPGRYLVIGGGYDEDRDGVYESRLGERKGSRNPANAGRSTRRIELDTRDSQPVRVRVRDADAQTIRDPQANLTLEAPPEASVRPALGLAYPGDGNSCMTDVLVIDRVRDEFDRFDDRADGQDGLKRRPLSISEPARGYIDKFRGTVWSTEKDQYVRADDPNATSAIDIPLDGPIGGQIRTNLKGSPEPEYLREIDPALTQVNEPDAGAAYAFVYLQRLANPLLPWNPLPGEPGYDENYPVNPYRTIDSISANLTVFNSSEEREEDGTSSSTPRSHFSGYERGYTASRANQAGAQMPSMWLQEPPSAAGRPGRNAQLQQRPPSNLTRVELAQRTEFWFNGVPDCTLGFLNRAYQDPRAPGDVRKAKPRLPFEWLPWNNRPYVSGNELLLVPRVRSSQLLKQFNTAEMVAAGGAGAQNSPYRANLGADGKPLGGGNTPPAYAHLENFFFTAQGLQNVNANDLKSTPTELYRLLDYVDTPSLFTGTQTWLNPAVFSQTLSPLGGTLDPRYNRLAPFNKASSFRDPGKVNLNTIVAEDVWRGLFHGDPDPTGGNNPQTHPGPGYDRIYRGTNDTRPSLLGSRRSDGNPRGSLFELNPQFPTFFNNPFRGGAEGELVPLDNMVRGDIDGTLLRSSGGVLGNNAQPGQPLFSAVTQQAFNSAQRNAFFWLQPLTRIDNLTTTRSNVYAVWVTVGFFEVEEAPDLATFVARNSLGSLDSQSQQALYNRVYPDGYALAREEGSETGGVRRLRGFYVMDRTIPVGFEPGADHNVDQAIRLRRRIE